MKARNARQSRYGIQKTDWINLFTLDQLKRSPT